MVRSRRCAVHRCDRTDPSIGDASDRARLYVSADVGVHFHTDDVDAAFARVRGAGANVNQEPTDQPWGARDFAVRDPSGDPLRIVQSPA